MDRHGSFEQSAAASSYDRLGDRAKRRRVNDRAIIENPLTHFTEAQLEQDVHTFVARFSHAQPRLDLDPVQLLRAARVAKEVRLFSSYVSREDTESSTHDLPVRLTQKEKEALRRERDVPLAERGMWTIIGTVSLAAFLQGFSQSSFNGGALWAEVYGLNTGSNATEGQGKSGVTSDDWKLGAANAAPFLAAALLGCPLALPVNHYLGRKGGVAVAAFLIMVTSLASAWARNWQELFGIRLVNGIGMGLKAVSTPILASETAVGFWRGTSILAWQLWVACGIAMGFVFNLIFSTSNDGPLAFGLIVASPLVPSLALLVLVIWFCDESPRFLMRKGTPKYNPAKAYQVLLRVRHTELQALRDFYLIQKSIEQEEILEKDRPRQYRQLLFDRRLRNALISSSIVALAQQLCGINVLAFYSGTLFSRAGADRQTAMLYSLGFGAVNFFFCLPAIRTIDTMGRRKWLLMTLPVMAFMMACAALSFAIHDSKARIGTVALFLFLFAAAYSPGLGPIPFTVASEAFPLSHREAGAASAIAVNLGFAGLLSIFFPSINSDLDDAGSLWLFSGLNVVALVLVFLLLEETKRRSLEDLDYIFAVSKRKFMQFQVFKLLPWFFRRYLFRKNEEKPSLYLDYIWGSPPTQLNERESQDNGTELTPYGESAPKHPAGVYE